MGKIFIGQTALDINVNIGADITGATVDLNYRKPSGTEGVFTSATGVSIVSRQKGLIKFRPQSQNDLDEKGIWTFWTTITFQDGSKANGEAFCEEIFRAGETN